METQVILARLEPYRNHLICHPMSEDDLTNLEQQISIKLPAGLYIFLQHVGLVHNLLATRVRPFLDLFGTSQQYAWEREWAVEFFGTKARNLIPFAHDGAGNLFAVELEHETVIFLDHEILEISTLDFTFNQWLDSVVSQIIESIDRHPIH
ncbi:MAG: SMI1/KNR4 family protein [Anaerolineae bacterium]